jgi:chromate transporter
VDPECQHTRLVELARLFLRLGTLGFGGPAVHLTLIEEETVQRRQWLSREAFVDLVGLTNLIPGPNSTEMAMAVGYRRAGWFGLVVAGTCFIAPAAAITMALAWAYVQFGTLPTVVNLLSGTGPAVVAVMTVGIVRMGKTALPQWPLAMIATIVCALGVAGIDPFVLLVAGAICGLAYSWARLFVGAILVLMSAQTAIFALATVSESRHLPRLEDIATFFFKVGAILYGSGYVLIALLRTLVSPLAWLTQRQLVDAVAAGQVTPGPVLTTATFVGYLLGGPAGALVATAAIFLPAFFFVSLLEPVIGRFGTSPRARRFLDVVNATAIGLMGAVTIQLALNLSAQPRLWPAAIAAAAIGLSGKSAIWMLMVAVGVTLLTNLAVW